MKRRAVIVQKPDEKPVPTEILAQAIVDIAAAGKRLAAARLNRRAVVLLIHDATAVPKRDIALVLDSIADLEKDYLR